MIIVNLYSCLFVGCSDGLESGKEMYWYTVCMLLHSGDFLREFFLILCNYSHKNSKFMHSLIGTVLINLRTPKELVNSMCAYNN